MVCNSMSRASARGRRAGGWMGRTNVGRARSGCGRCGLPPGLRRTPPRRSGRPARRARRSPTTRPSGRRPTAGREQPAVLADVPTIGEWVDATPLPRDPARGRRPAARLRDLRRRRHVAAGRAGRRLGRDRARRGVPRRAAGRRPGPGRRRRQRAAAHRHARRRRSTSASRRTAPASPTSATTTCSPSTSPPASSASSPPTAARRS